MRRGRRVKSDGALAATSSHDDADEDGDEGHRTPKARMSVRAVEEREETAGLLARIDEINEEKEKLIGQLKQQQVAGITDDYFDEKPTRILAAGALHGLRSSRLPPSRESSEGQACGGSPRSEAAAPRLVNRRKSARGATASTSAASASASTALRRLFREPAAWACTEDGAAQGRRGAGARCGRLRDAAAARRAARGHGNPAPA